MKKILETQRLVLREIDPESDAAFLFELLNTPKFLKYIGDRGVRSIDDAIKFADERYCESYRIHGYGLYVVDLRSDDESTPSTQIGICGFVRRETLPGPDLGFAYLPDYEGKGYGLESGEAMMRYGRETLGFTTVLAITTPDNDASVRLLEKLGFSETKMADTGDVEKLRLFTHNSQ